MADLLIGARYAAAAARLVGQCILDAAIPEGIISRYRALAGAGLAAKL